MIFFKVSNLPLLSLFYTCKRACFFFTCRATMTNSDNFSVFFGVSIDDSSIFFRVNIDDTTRGLSLVTTDDFNIIKNITNNNTNNDLRGDSI